jgi:hypothetical protein
MVGEEDPAHSAWAKDNEVQDEQVFAETTVKGPRAAACSGERDSAPNERRRARPASPEEQEQNTETTKTWVRQD